MIITMDTAKNTEPTIKEEIANKPVVRKFLVPVLLLVILALLGFIAFMFANPAFKLSQVKNKSAKTTSTLEKVTTPNTANWKTYTNTEAGFSFKYPPSVALESENASKGQLHLSVAVEKLTDIPEDLPMFMGRTDALAQKELLTSGKAVGAVKIGALSGNTSTTLSLFEVCSVMFVRKLTFFPSDYRVIITLTGPEKEIMAAMPDFFTKDPKNCGNNLMWKKDDNRSFTKTLSQKQGKGIAQLWFDTFTDITNSVALIPTSTPAITATSTPSALLNYQNNTYGFSLSYPDKYKALDSQDDLYGYPHGIVLLYTGGQAYDIIVEIWNTKAEYETEYGPRVGELTVLEKDGKFITLLNNTKLPENQAVIASFKFLTN